MKKSKALTIQHPSLASISSAYLLSVDNFDSENNILIGRVKKTWGSCGLAIEEKNSFKLWQPVTWDDPNLSPVEIMYFGADPSRDFKYGEQIILVEGVSGFETFLPTSPFMQKLEIIFNKKMIGEMVDTLSADELTDWIEDLDLGPFFSDLITKKGKFPHALLVKKEVDSKKPSLSDAFIIVIKKLTAPERVKIFSLLVENSNLSFADDLSRIQSFLSIDLAESEVDCNLLLLKYLSSTDTLHTGMIAHLMSSTFTVENLKLRPGLISIARDLWREIILQTDNYDILARFKTYWSLLSEMGKKSFAPAMSLAMVTVGPFYNTELYEFLRAEMKSSHDPYYFELLRPVWSDVRFYKDETSRFVYLEEDLIELAKNHSFFLPLLKTYQETMVLLNV